MNMLAQQSGVYREVVRRVRVLLADDHQIVAAGLKKLLADEYDLVGTVSDGAELVAAAATLQPDVIVADISMPKMNGIEATRAIRQAQPNTKFVILSVHNDSAYVEEAFLAGARGYVLKESAAEELFTAIETVLSGRTF